MHSSGMDVERISRFARTGKIVVQQVVFLRSDFSASDSMNNE